MLIFFKWPLLIFVLIGMVACGGDDDGGSPPAPTPGISEDKVEEQASDESDKTTQNETKENNQDSNVEVAVQACNEEQDENCQTNQEGVSASMETSNQQGESQEDSNNEGQKRLVASIEIEVPDPENDAKQFKERFSDMNIKEKLAVDLESIEFDQSLRDQVNISTKEIIYTKDEIEGLIAKHVRQSFEENILKKIVSYLRMEEDQTIDEIVVKYETTENNSIVDDISFFENADGNDKKAFQDIFDKDKSSWLKDNKLYSSFKDTEVRHSGVRRILKGKVEVQIPVGGIIGGQTLLFRNLLVTTVVRNNLFIAELNDSEKSETGGLFQTFGVSFDHSQTTFEESSLLGLFKNKEEIPDFLENWRLEDIEKYGVFLPKDNHLVISTGEDLSENMAAYKKNMEELSSTSEAERAEIAEEGGHDAVDPLVSAEISRLLAKYEETQEEFEAALAALAKEALEDITALERKKMEELSENQSQLQTQLQTMADQLSSDLKERYSESVNSFQDEIERLKAEIQVYQKYFVSIDEDIKKEQLQATLSTLSEEVEAEKEKIESRFDKERQQIYDSFGKILSRVEQSEDQELEVIN